MKQYRIFVSSTKCLLMKERHIVIDSILNGGQIPIAQEYDFQDENNVLTLEKCIQKVTEADAVFLLLNNWYGSIVGANQHCDNCIVKDVCNYASDNMCSISYTHFEYLLAKQQNKKVYILIKDGMEDDETFTSSRNTCVEECKLRKRSCADSCRQHVSIRKVPDQFYEWVKSLNQGWIAEFSDNESLSTSAGRFVSRLPSDLANQSDLGLISCAEIAPMLQDSEKYNQIIENGFLEIFPNQDKAIEDATKTCFETTHNGPIVRVLCFRGNSFVNGADALWEPFIFSDLNRNKKLEFVLANLDNEEILQRRFSAFPRYDSLDAFKTKYCHKMKEIEDILLSSEDSYSCDLYIHNEALLPFRLLFIGDYLYLSFFLNSVPATKSPVYKLKRGAEFYDALSEYYERVKHNSQKKECIL